MPDPITTTLAAVGRSLTLVLLEVGACCTNTSDALSSCGEAAVTITRAVDGVGVGAAGKAVARTVAVDRGDRGAVRVDDRRGDGRDALVELADRPGVARGGGWSRAGAGSAPVASTVRGVKARAGARDTRAIRGGRLRGEQHEPGRDDVQGERAPVQSRSVTSFSVST